MYHPYHGNHMFIDQKIWVHITSHTPSQTTINFLSIWSPYRPDLLWVHSITYSHMYMHLHDYLSTYLLPPLASVFDLHGIGTKKAAGLCDVMSAVHYTWTKHSLGKF